MSPKISIIVPVYNVEKYLKHLWNIIEGYIVKFKLEDIYSEALKNRVAISMIGLGLNEIKANRGMLQASIGVIY